MFISGANNENRVGITTMLSVYVWLKNRYATNVDIIFYDTCLKTAHLRWRILDVGCYVYDFQIKKKVWSYQFDDYIDYIYTFIYIYVCVYVSIAINACWILLGPDTLVITSVSYNS